MSVTEDEGAHRLLKIIESVFDYDRHYEDSKHKSEICRAAVVRSRQCKYLDNCDFAHEIRQLCPRVFDLSNFKQQDCINWGAGCQYGVRCLYLHDEKVYELSPQMTLLHSRSERKFRIVKDQGDGTVCVHTIPTDCTARRKLGRSLMNALWSFVKEQYHRIPSGNSKKSTTPEKKVKTSVKPDTHPMQCCTVIKNTKTESPEKKEPCPEQVITDLLKMDLVKEEKEQEEEEEKLIPIMKSDPPIYHREPSVTSVEKQPQQLPEQPYTFQKGAFANAQQPRVPPPGFGKPSPPPPTNQMYLPPPFVPGQQWLPTQTNQVYTHDPPHQMYAPDPSPPYSQGSYVYSLSWSPSSHYDARDDGCAMPYTYPEYSPPISNENPYYQSHSQHHSRWWNSRHEYSNQKFSGTGTPPQFTNGVMLPPSHEPSPSRSLEKQDWVDDDNINVEKKEQSISPQRKHLTRDTALKVTPTAVLNDIKGNSVDILSKEPDQLRKVIEKYEKALSDRDAQIKMLLDDRQCSRILTNSRVTTLKSMAPESHV